MFAPIQQPGYEVGEWQLGDYQIELFVKYAAHSALRSVKKTTITIRENEFSVLTSNQTRFITVSNLDEYLKLL
ncbi:hypothetical protein IGB42_03233 [Andreprevotia sp. IGB-42]|nr:hypothetical protein IGB42_03233 [Andreprevotia sp. IGB-42]